MIDFSDMNTPELMIDIGVKTEVKIQEVIAKELIWTGIGDINGEEKEQVGTLAGIIWEEYHVKPTVPFMGMMIII